MNKFIQGLLNCIFPPLCLGCKNKLVQGELFICTVCFSSFPETNFHTLLHNPVTDRLLGKTIVTYGFALYRLRKNSLLERVLIAMKYKNQSMIAKLFGIQYGHILCKTSMIKTIDGIVTIGLQKHKNTSYLFAKGLSSVLNVPIYQKCANLMQTQRNQAFGFNHLSCIKQKHVLLVDDVISTGSKLANSANVLLKIGAKAVSIATIAIVEDSFTLTVLN